MIDRSPFFDGMPATFFAEWIAPINADGGSTVARSTIAAIQRQLLLKATLVPAVVSVP